MNSIDLDGRSAIVTGGAQGIGQAIAARLLDSGAEVLLWDIDADALRATAALFAAKGRVYTSVVDVADAARVEQAAAEAARAMGKIEILVTSAGIAGPNGKTWEYPLDAWNRVIAVNLNGVFHACRAVVPYMRRSGYGRIVNIASIAGKEGNPNAAAYSASKAAVIALTKSLGKELAGDNIAVNYITPSACRTRLFEQITEEHIQYMLAKIPRGRFVETEEIGAMVAWAVSEENSYTTGAVFDLSGGRATY